MPRDIRFYFVEDNYNRYYLQVFVINFGVGMPGRSAHEFISNCGTETLYYRARNYGHGRPTFRLRSIKMLDTGRFKFLIVSEYLCE